MLQEECFVRSWYCRPFSVSRLGIPGEHINSNWLNEPPSRNSCPPPFRVHQQVHVHLVQPAWITSNQRGTSPTNERQRAFQAFVDVDLVFVGTLGPAHARGRGQSRPGRRISAWREVRRRRAAVRARNRYRRFIMNVAVSVKNSRSICSACAGNWVSASARSISATQRSRAR